MVGKVHCQHCDPLLPRNSSTLSAPPEPRNNAKDTDTPDRFVTIAPMQPGGATGSTGQSGCLGSAFAALSTGDSANPGPACSVKDPMDPWIPALLYLQYGGAEREIRKELPCSGPAAQQPSSPRYYGTCSSISRLGLLGLLSTWAPGHLGSLGTWQPPGRKTMSPPGHLGQVRAQTGTQLHHRHLSKQRTWSASTVVAIRPRRKLQSATTQTRNSPSNSTSSLTEQDAPRNATKHDSDEASPLGHLS